MTPHIDRYEAMSPRERAAQPPQPRFCRTCQVFTLGIKVRTPPPHNFLLVECPVCRRDLGGV
jgi:hypothetical protein